MSSAAINIPVSLPSPSSSASSGSPNTPATPLTPNSGHHVTFANKALPLGGGAEQFNFNALNLDNTANNTSTAPTTGNTAANTTSNGGPVRRKTSRRANTAERRATHNAVERQRRETLNGRFLDLAALLPNLASVRRPSKSAIVNSSIALIHTHRRSRATAARELRLLKLEADALRAEVNEWRERAGMGLTRIEEPARTRDFEELVSGGLEEAEEGLLEAERRALEIVKEGLRMDDMGNDGSMGPFAYGVGAYGDDDDDDSSDGQGNRMTRPGSQGSAHSIPSMNMPVAIPRQNSVSNPVIFDPSAALLQSHPTHNAGINAYNGFDFNTQSLGLSGMPATKGANQWQSGLFTPQQTYAQPASFGSSPSAASFLGGFGLRADDDASSTSDVGSVVGFDLNQVNVVHAGLAQHRSRSSSSLANIQTAGLKAGTPPATAATYADSNTAGDAFAAAYGAFPSAVPAVGRVPGGGNVYGAAMGLFM